MPLFSSLKSKMRRQSISSTASNPNQGQISKDEKDQNKLQASDVLGDSPSFKNGNGNGNGHSAISQSQSRPSQSASSLKQKNSSSMLKMFSGTRSPSSNSVSSNTGSVSKGNSGAKSSSKKRNSIMSSSVDNLGRTSSTGANHSSSSPPVSNSAAAAVSLRSFNNQKEGGNNIGSLPTLNSTTPPGALVHAFNHPDANTPTSATFNSSAAASNPRPSDLFAGKAMEWGSIGPGRDAPAPKAEDLQTFLKARRQWVPTFVTEEDAPSAAEENQRVQDISFSNPETSTSVGVMSLKDLDASHERKKKLLGELPLTGGSIGGPSSVINAASSTSTDSSKGNKAMLQSPSSPPPASVSSTARPESASSPSSSASPGKEKPGRSTSFRTSIFSSNKRTNSKDQSIPSVPTTKASDPQKADDGKESSKIATGAGAGALGAGIAAAVATTASANPNEASRESKTSADTQATTTAPAQKEGTEQESSNPSSSTTNPDSGSADVLASSNVPPSTSENSATSRPASSRIRESIDSSAQGFQTPEAGSTRNSMAMEDGNNNGEVGKSEVGDETIVNQEDSAGAGSKSPGGLPSLDDKDLENGEVVGTNHQQKPSLTSLSPEKPPRPVKAEARTPTTSRPPSPSNQLKSDDTLSGQTAA